MSTDSSLHLPITGRGGILQLFIHTTVPDLHHGLPRTNQRVVSAQRTLPLWGSPFSLRLVTAALQVPGQQLQLLDLHAQWVHGRVCAEKRLPARDVPGRARCVHIRAGEVVAQILQNVWQQRFDRDHPRQGSGADRGQCALCNASSKCIED